MSMIITTGLLLLLSVATGILGSVGQTRKSNNKHGIEWSNYTATGKAQIFLLLLTLIVGAVKINEDIQEKKKAEKEQAERDRLAVVQHDQLIDSVKKLFRELGLSLEQKPDGTLAAFIQNLKLLEDLINKFKSDRGIAVDKPIQPTAKETPVDHNAQPESPTTETVKEKPAEEKKPAEKPLPDPTPPPPSITMQQDRSLRTGSESHHQVSAKVIFVNERNFPVELYSNSVHGSGDIVSMPAVGPGESQETNALFVTYEDYTSLNELDKAYTFYFYGEENGKKVFGKMRLGLKPYTVYTVKLNSRSMPMTPTGEKDQNALRRQGIQFE